MKAEELIKNYVQCKRMKQEYDFSKHITRNYVPYAEKCALVKSVVDATSYEEVGGIKYYRRNTKGMLFIFTMQIIQKYTDLEFSNEEVANVYDLLMESGTMNGLMSAVPEEEINILRGMLDMERDDIEVNTRSLISFFETKADTMKLAFDSIVDLVNRPEIQAKIAKLSE